MLTSFAIILKKQAAERFASMPSLNNNKKAAQSHYEHDEGEEHVLPEGGLSREFHVTLSATDAVEAAKFSLDDLVQHHPHHHQENDDNGERDNHNEFYRNHHHYHHSNVELEEVAFLAKRPQSQSSKKKALFVHRYLMREALVNRAVFLVMIALITIFIVLVCNGGMINNMEWIRDNILSEASGNWDLIRENHILPVTNWISDEKEKKSPWLLVVQVPAFSALATEPVKSFFQRTGQIMNNRGLNSTGAVFSQHESWASEEGEEGEEENSSSRSRRRRVVMLLANNQSFFEVCILDRRNASSVSEMIFLLLERMHVSLIYMDIRNSYSDMATAADAMSSAVSLFSQVFSSTQTNEENRTNEANGAAASIVVDSDLVLSLFPVTGKVTGLQPVVEEILHPPCVPFFDPQFLLVRKSIHTTSLFGDAAAKVSQDREFWNASEGFLLNALVNDGRKCFSRPTNKETTKNKDNNNNDDNDEEGLGLTFFIDQ
jgi:hypothetical protein